MVAGFSYAPVTKGILISVSIASVLVSLFQLKPLVHLQIHPHLAVQHQWYRLVVQHVAFTNSSELFLALLLFYNAGVKVERTFGTFKFASFLVVVSAIYTVAQVMALVLISSLLARLSSASESRGEGSGSGSVAGSGGEAWKSWLANGASPAGPWGPLFALVYQHHYLIPHLWSISVGGIVLTDKAIQISCLALLLALSQPPSTLFASALGVLVSWLYRSTARLRSYRIPVRLYQILSHLLSPWIGHTRLPQRSWRVEPPVRRTLQAREARLAEHNAAVANLNRSSAAVGGLGMPRIANLLRRRNQTQQVPPMTRGAADRTAGSRSEGVEAEAQAQDSGWNDMPPDASIRTTLGTFPRIQVMAAVQRSDGNLEEALRNLRSDSSSNGNDNGNSGSPGPQQPAN